MTRKRILEIIPGALIWTALLGAVLASFFAPLAAIVFIILFDLYWLFRIVFFTVSLLSSWGRYRRESTRDWFAILKTHAGWDEHVHVVFLPTYKEPYEVVKATFECLRASTFPLSQMVIVLAGEGRDEQNFLAMANRIQAEYGDLFLKFFVTVHPAGVVGEMPGKGSNLHYAGKQVEAEVETIVKTLAATKPGVTREKVIVSSFDVDTCVPSQYFSYLTFLYMSQPDPTRCSYQPVPLFNNNMWNATAPVRVASFGTTFWLLNELGRPESLMTFSSHSMSWKMLTDVGFWQNDMVSEDSRIFLQGLVHYHGDYRVVPMYMGVNVDAVEGKGYLDSLTALYKQQRRWAYGVENFPYMVEKFSADPLMPWTVKLRFLFFQIEGMFTWATAPLLIFILGQLPLYVASNATDAFVQSAPFTLQWIMRFAMIGAFASAILSFFFMPHKPAHHSKWRWLVMVVQWAVLPVTFVLFGSFPAIDAQTRLMLGKYLGFNVTAKQRS